ncbi:hypothetical protein GB937_006840 [Aspergillus fischeri]|nr:hypothetical protein GB937_006840 [Aspergillus fischeri]
MEKISKEREGAWDWGSELQKSAVPLVDFWRGLERYFGAKYTLYQGLSTDPRYVRSRYCVWVRSTPYCHLCSTDADTEPEQWILGKGLEDWNGMVEKRGAAMTDHWSLERPPML